MKRDPKRDEESIKSLLKLLKQIVDSPSSSHDPDLIASLTSQSALARYGSPNTGIFPMSLNHQKFASTKYLGSYDALDRARRAAAGSIQNGAGGSPRRKDDRTSLLAKIKALDRVCQFLREDLFLMQRAYELRCEQARRYALAAGGNLPHLCQKEQLEIDRGLSLRRTEAHSSNVVQLPRRRRE